MVKLSDETLRTCEAIAIINSNMFSPVDEIVEKLQTKLYGRHLPVTYEEVDCGFRFTISMSDNGPPLVLFVRPESIGVDNRLGPEGRGAFLEPVIRIDYDHLPI